MYIDCKKKTNVSPLPGVERQKTITEYLKIIFTVLVVQTTFSGINDFDYPSLSSPSVGLAGLELVSLLKRVPLPAELMEQFNCILSLFICWCLLLSYLDV